MKLFVWVPEEESSILTYSLKETYLLYSMIVLRWKEQKLQIMILVSKKSLYQYKRDKYNLDTKLDSVRHPSFVTTLESYGYLLQDIS